MNYPLGTVQILGSGVSSGYQFHPYHYYELYNQISGIQFTLGLNPNNGYASLTARISGIENSETGEITGVSAPLFITNGTLSGLFASTIQSGFLTVTDWNNFNNKSNVTFTSGNLTSSTPGISIAGGTNALIGTGTTINIQQADASHSGILASGDWSTFNNKINSGINLGAGTGIFGIINGTSLQFKSLVSGANINITSDANTITISSTATGGGSSNSFNAPLVLNGSIVSGKFASAFESGFLLSTDWTTFNAKQIALGFLPLNSVISGTITSLNSGLYNFGSQAQPFATGFFTSLLISGLPVSGIVGPQGATGPQGLSGIQGIQGISGTIQTFVTPLILNGLNVSGLFASTNDSGFLSRSDWNNFNSKAATSGATISGTLNSYVLSGSLISGNDLTVGRIFMPISGWILQGPSSVLAAPTGLQVGNFLSQEGYFNIYGSIGTSPTNATATIDLENRGTGIYNYPEISLARSRGNGFPSFSGVLSGDDLGHLGWWASVGNSGNYVNTAYINATASETMSATNSGSNLNFYVIESGVNQVAVQKLIIASSGLGNIGTSQSPFGFASINVISGLAITVSGFPVIVSGANLGNGTGVFAAKAGSTTQFKSFISGIGIGLNSDANTITIFSTIPAPTGFLPLTTVAPLVINNNILTGLFASATDSGFLKNADWVTFNNKQIALGYIPLNSNLSGNITSSSSGSYDIGSYSAPERTLYFKSGIIGNLSGYEVGGLVIQDNILPKNSGLINLGIQSSGFGTIYADSGIFALAVGIGKTNPSVALDIVGAINLTAGVTSTGGNISANTIIGSNGFTTNGTNVTLNLMGRNFTNSGIAVNVLFGGQTASNLSGRFAGVAITPTYNQPFTSGGASATDLLINRFESSVGSGVQLLFDAQITGISKFSISSTGVVTVSNNVIPNISGVPDLGTATLPYRTIFSKSGVIGSLSGYNPGGIQLQDNIALNSSGVINIGSGPNPIANLFSTGIITSFISGYNNKIILASGTSLTNSTYNANTLGDSINSFLSIYTNQINGAAIVRSMFNEILTASADGTTSVYYTLFTPYQQEIQLYKNGLYMLSGVNNDYQINSGNAIQMTVAPIAGAKLIVNYTYLG